jgi:predicted PilT family ATPase
MIHGSLRKMGIGLAGVFSRTVRFGALNRLIDRNCLLLLPAILITRISFDNN